MMGVLTQILLAAALFCHGGFRGGEKHAGLGTVRHVTLLTRLQENPLLAALGRN
jgi:hypothetical protein